MKKVGIDVSYHQGTINWPLVKESIDFAILRCGFGSDKIEQDDVKFRYNADMCTKLGIPFGVYLYSYARNVDEALSEANHTLRLIRDYKLDYPVYHDVETNSYVDQNSNETQVLISDIYCKKIEEAGYYVGIYSNRAFLDDKLGSVKLDRYDKWVAEWSSKPIYRKSFGMWQYTSDGFVNGINGRVDMNIAYLDYPNIIKNKKLNGNNNSTVVKPDVSEDVKNKSYIVKAGDNLTKIAKLYKTTVDSLVKKNNISNPNKIYPGQIIYLPNNIVDPIIYIVKAGDNLTKIAKLYNISWKTLYAKNKQIIGANPGKIYTGQRLII